MSVTDLLLQLLRIPSLSSQEDELILYCQALLETNGFTTVLQPVGDGSNNLYATIGKPRVILQAHADVVAPLLPLQVTSTQVMGRGACDTKGSLASMICAAIAAKNEGVSNFGLLVTVGEEADFRGAVAFKNSRFFESTAFYVVGEPTALRVVNAQYGFESYTITTQGKAAHSSQPELGINAIESLIQVLNDLQSFPKVESSPFSIVMIDGGRGDNVVPDQASITVSIRVSPTDTTNYKKGLERLANTRAVVTTNTRILSTNTVVPSTLNFLGEMQTVKYCTELSFFGNGIVYGPGKIQLAHTAKESITKRELDAAVAMYRQILLTF